MENVFQHHLNTYETLKAKQDFELKCKDAGVIPMEYISDNSPPSPMLPISPTSPNFNDLLELAHIMTMSHREGNPDHHVHCKNYDALLSHTLA